MYTTRDRDIALRVLLEEDPFKIADEYHLEPYEVREITHIVCCWIDFHEYWCLPDKHIHQCITTLLIKNSDLYIGNLRYYVFV